MGLLLPALAQAITAQENGQTQQEALSGVMPPLLQVWYLFCGSDQDYTIFNTKIILYSTNQSRLVGILLKVKSAIHNAVQDHACIHAWANLCGCLDASEKCEPMMTQCTVIPAVYTWNVIPVVYTWNVIPAVYT